MMTTIEINCPPSKAFRYLTDPTLFPEWQSDVVRVRMDSGAPSTVGATFTTVRMVGGAAREMRQRISECVTPIRWSSVGVSGPIRAAATIAIEPFDDGRKSRVTFTLDLKGQGMGVALLPLVRRQAEKAAPVSYRRAKANLETANLETQDTAGARPHRSGPVGRSSGGPSAQQPDDAEEPA
jgi:uncharacterized protein YndB with AHSA1/START domain